MHQRSALVGMGVFLLSVFIGSPGGAQELDSALVIKKVSVLDTEDRTGVGIGSRIAALLADEIDSTLRFDRIPSNRPGLRPPYADAALKQAAERYGIDAFILSAAAPQGSAVVITAVLSSGHSAGTLARESITLRDFSAPDAVEAGVRQIVSRLIGRLPYRALVTEIRGDAVTLDAGRVHGLAAGQKVKIIEITGSKRHPFSGEHIEFQTREVAEIVLSTVGDMSSTGRTGSLAQAAAMRPNHKAVFTPSPGVLEQSIDRKRELVAWKKRIQETPVREKTKAVEPAPGHSPFTLEAGAAAVINTYNFKSDGLDFVRKSNAYPAMEVRAVYWPS
ncbi:MAG TPA: hypothetical protein VI702_04040, partial [Nitrospiria bacterium]